MVTLLAIPSTCPNTLKARASSEQTTKQEHEEVQLRKVYLNVYTVEI